jgi:hypothetical protein
MKSAKKMSVNQLLSLARKEETKYNSCNYMELFPVVKSLKAKGFTYEECYDWLDELGQVPQDCLGKKTLSQFSVGMSAAFAKEKKNKLKQLRNI